MMKFVFFATIILLQLGLGYSQFNRQDLIDLFNQTEGLESKESETAEAFNVTGLDESECLMNCMFCPFGGNKCPHKDVTFWITTRANPNKTEQLTLENLDPSKVQAGKPWKFIIHGYTKSKDEIPNPELKKEYFKKGEYNILSIDFSPLAVKPCYVTAVKNVPLITECAAQFLDALVDKKMLQMSDLHVIGFSLGAQIAGRLYKYLKSGKPSRVTALDPAAPLFDGIINSSINKRAGDFVDVIHTDILLKGKIDALGHVDFYPNGGSFQPGCLFNGNMSLSGCNHDRSPYYFAESINSKTGFYAVPCGSYLTFIAGMCRAEEKDLVLMGEYTPRTARGVYQLQTNSNSPFALGIDKRTIKK